MYQELPAFLKRLNYQTPTDCYHTVVQDTFKFEGTCFDWLAAHPDHLNYLHEYMGSRRPTVEETWLAVYPVEAETKGWNPEAPMLIDIGGGIGHICAHFKQVFPNIPGRVILEDRPEAIATALPTPGVEKIAYDFFKPQPIKGMKSSWPKRRIYESSLI